MISNSWRLGGVLALALVVTMALAGSTATTGAEASTPRAHLYTTLNAPCLAAASGLSGIHHRHRLPDRQLHGLELLGDAAVGPAVHARRLLPARRRRRSLQHGEGRLNRAAQVRGLRLGQWRRADQPLRRQPVHGQPRLMRQ